MAGNQKDFQLDAPSYLRDNAADRTLAEEAEYATFTRVLSQFGRITKVKEIAKEEKVLLRNKALHQNIFEISKMIVIKLQITDRIEKKQGQSNKHIAHTYNYGNDLLNNLELAESNGGIATNNTALTGSSPLTFRLSMQG